MNDLLSQAIRCVRPHLHRDLPLADRCRAFWAGVAAAVDLAAQDQIESDFLDLARTTGLAADLGRFAADVASVANRDPVVRSFFIRLFDAALQKRDLLAYLSARIAALEDRLALVDNGPEAAAAKHATWKTAALRRATAGEPPLCFTLADAANGDVVVQWTEEK